MYNNELKIVTDFKWAKLMLSGVPIFKVLKDNPHRNKIISDFINEKRL